VLRGTAPSTPAGAAATATHICMGTTTWPPLIWLLTSGSASASITSTKASKAAGSSTKAGITAA